MDHVTQVHHAVVDLYEVEDRESVDVQDVAKHLGCGKRSVQQAFRSLENQGIMACDASGTVVECRNNGYYPTTLVQK